MTQARILDAAAGLFAEAGYERATIRAIAAAAGVDAGLVMHYFGSKVSLFRAVMHSAPGARRGARRRKRRKNCWPGWRPR